MTDKATEVPNFEGLEDTMILSTGRAFDFGNWYLAKLGKAQWGNRHALLYHARNGNIEPLNGWPYEFKVGSIKALCNWLPDKPGRETKILDYVYLDMGRKPDTQLAKALDVSTRTISRRRKAMKIGPFKVGENPPPAVRFADVEGRVKIRVIFEVKDEGKPVELGLDTDLMTVFIPAKARKLHGFTVDYIKAALTQAFETGQILQPRVKGKGIVELDLVTPVESLKAIVDTFDIDPAVWSRFLETHGQRWAIKRAAAIVAQAHPTFDPTDESMHLEIMHETRRINPALAWVNLTGVKSVVEFGLEFIYQPDRIDSQ